MYLLLANMKKRKITAMAPIAVTGIFVPLVCGHYSMRYAGYEEEMLRETLTLLHTCIPMLASWWVVMLYQDFFSWEGNELLYYYYSQWEMFKEYAIVVLAYSVLLSGVFLAVRGMAGVPPFVLAQLLGETWCVAALAYFCAFLLLNTGGSLMAVTGYCIYVNMFDTLDLFGFMSIFPHGDRLTGWDGRLFAGTLAAAAILNAAGVLCMKFRRGYR